MKSIISIAILFLLIAPFALADEVTLLSPQNGVTLDPLRNGFSYSPAIKDRVKDCSLLIDGNVSKTIQFNDFINKKMLTINPELEDGSYSWAISCTKEDGQKILSETRNCTVKNVEDAVEIKSSGVFRGSMAHEFAFENDADQEPVVVKKLAAGDFVWILFKIPPSNVKKELYVRRFSTEQGKQFLILEDLKKREEYKIYAGETTTVNITPSSVNIKFIGIELNRATILVSPVLSEQSSTGTASEEGTPADETKETATEGSQAKPDGNTGTAVDAQKPTEESSKENEPQVPSDAENEQKPGVFKKFFSWLTAMFGA